jgi:hypothetical protein
MSNRHDFGHLNRWSNNKKRGKGTQQQLVPQFSTFISQQCCSNITSISTIVVTAIWHGCWQGYCHGIVTAICHGYCHDYLIIAGTNFTGFFPTSAVPLFRFV